MQLLPRSAGRDTRLPKQVFYSEPCHGKRSQGGQEKCFKDHLEKV